MNFTLSILIVSFIYLILAELSKDEGTKSSDISYKVMKSSIALN